MLTVIGGALDFGGGEAGAGRQTSASSSIPASIDRRAARPPGFGISAPAFARRRPRSPDRPRGRRARSADAGEMRGVGRPSTRAAPPIAARRPRSRRSSAAGIRHQRAGVRPPPPPIPRSPARPARAIRRCRGDARRWPAVDEGSPADRGPPPPIAAVIGGGDSASARRRSPAAAPDPPIAREAGARDPPMPGRCAALAGRRRGQPRRPGPAAPDRGGHRRRAARPPGFGISAPADAVLRAWARQVGTNRLQCDPTPTAQKKKTKEKRAD